MEMSRVQKKLLLYLLFLLFFSFFFFSFFLNEIWNHIRIPKFKYPSFFFFSFFFFLNSIKSTVGKGWREKTQKEQISQGSNSHLSRVWYFPILIKDIKTFTWQKGVQFTEGSQGWVPIYNYSISLRTHAQDENTTFSQNKKKKKWKHNKQ